MRHYSFLYAVLLLALSSCTGAESGPITLPVPFSGDLTQNPHVVISDGTPVEIGGGATLKSQATDGNPTTIVWDNFNAKEGCAQGRTTFFLDTMSAPIITPLSTGEVRRSYTMTACFDLGTGTEVCSSNFQCFEYPAESPSPSFAASDVVPEDPEAQAVSRKALCSGNIDSGVGAFHLGDLIDARFVLGMVELSNGDFRFHSQERSSIFIQGVSASSCLSGSQSDILTTLLFEGFSEPVPPALGEPPQLMNPIFIPGLLQPVGIERDTILGVEVMNEGEQIEVVFDVQLCVSTSCLLVHNLHLVSNAVPEINPVLADLVRSDFSQGIDPAALNRYLSGATAYFSIAGGESENGSIDCSEQTGMFRQLCEEFGPLKIDFRCDSFSNLAVEITDFPAIFNLQGSWVLSRQ